MTAAARNETRAHERHQCHYDDRDGDYGLVADVVIDAFNPPDDDIAEEGVLVEAIYLARDFIEAQACTCPAGTDFEDEACRRCKALGRLHDRGVCR